jgi:hypothetical protein
MEWTYPMEGRRIPQEYSRNCRRGALVAGQSPWVAGVSLRKIMRGFGRRGTGGDLYSHEPGGILFL